MKQSYIVVNIDKKQYLNPDRFVSDLDLMELDYNFSDLANILTILLTDNTRFNNGDSNSLHDYPKELVKLIGSWAGNRVVMAGEYADHLKFLSEKITKKELRRMEKEHLNRVYQEVKRVNLYMYAKEFFEDISHKVLRLMKYDNSIPRMF